VPVPGTTGGALAVVPEQAINPAAIRPTAVR